VKLVTKGKSKVKKEIRVTPEPPVLGRRQEYEGDTGAAVPNGIDGKRRCRPELAGGNCKSKGDKGDELVPQVLM